MVFTGGILSGDCDFKLIEVIHQAHFGIVGVDSAGKRIITGGISCMDVIVQEAKFGTHAKNCQWPGRIDAITCGCVKTVRPSK